MYRLGSDLAPYATHPDMPQFHDMVAQSDAELAAFGAKARSLAGYAQCPEHVKRRLVLENDDIRFSAADVLWISQRCGVPCVFDYQHFWCLNPERLDMRETLQKFLATWAEGVRPKIHFSSPRTELREVKRRITPRQREAARAGRARKSAQLTKAPVKPTARVTGSTPPTRRICWPTRRPWRKGSGPRPSRTSTRAGWLGHRNKRQPDSSANGDRLLPLPDMP